MGKYDATHVEFICFERFLRFRDILSPKSFWRLFRLDRSNRSIGKRDCGNQGSRISRLPSVVFVFQAAHPLKSNISFCITGVRSLAQNSRSESASSISTLSELDAGVSDSYINSGSLTKLQSFLFHFLFDVFFKSRVKWGLFRGTRRLRLALLAFVLATILARLTSLFRLILLLFIATTGLGSVSRFFLGAVALRLFVFLVCTSTTFTRRRHNGSSVLVRHIHRLQLTRVRLLFHFKLHFSIFR
mmetsp:Transcript_11614/g.22264  ORF Transcript_11614/g.22264 Transcript_11614/m.22264 type:complete len:244 (-) Transcript_11614:201-932(-)